MMTQISEVQKYPEGAARIRPLTRVVADVDRKLKEMEEERAVLLYIRSLALREAARITTSLPGLDRKKALRYLMKEDGDDILSICSSLGIQKQVVGDILEEMEEELGTD